MRMNGEIEITLMSDLCASSGYSYAGIVDSDVCYDDYGIPYIPAKRLKGCLRETCESILYSMIDESMIEKLFGVRGNNKVQGIILENAYISDYEEIRKEISDLKKINPESVTAQKILDSFCSVQAQTQLDKNGCAEENTLRFTRVVDQISPITKEKQVFRAAISYEEEDKDIIAKIVAGTRSIGLKRNRGLGQVRCRLNNASAKTKYNQCNIDETKTYKINYVIKNCAPLMLTENSDNESLIYIKGQTMLGYVAGKYLADSNHSAESEEFYDLFLNGKTIYNNLYPSDYKDSKQYYPAPQYINKLKKTGEYVNTLFDLKEVGAGNQPKKLRNTFVYINPKGEIETKEVEKKVIYHSSHKGIKQGREDDKVLFTFEAIKENQEFSGSIIVLGKYVEVITNILNMDNVTIGKSRSSQYASCDVVTIDVCEYKDKSLEAKEGDRILVTFLSDGVFHNGNDYTVYPEDIRKLLAADLGIQYKETEENQNYLTGKLVNGYLGVWNLRRPTVPVVEAGSAVTYTLITNSSISSEYVGERNFEGYGMVKVEKLMNGENEAYISEIKKQEIGTQKVVVIKGRKLIEQVYLDNLKKEIICLAISNSLKSSTASKWSRVILMFKESVAENRTDYKAAYKAFLERVESIKTQSDKDEIIKYLFTQRLCSRDNKELQFASYMRDKNLDGIKAYQSIGWQEGEIDELLNSLWEEYVLTLLTDQKYLGKREA